MDNLRELLERRQVAIYLCAVVVAALIALLIPGTSALESAVNPALALMLFVTFLQVPVADLRRALTQVRFLGALLIANFVAIPLLVAIVSQWAPADPLTRLGVLLVLLTPCIDYVVTFSHLGKADARLLLAATPALLISQMVLLPVYLRLLLGSRTDELVQSGPFVDAFLWLIAVPLILAAITQAWASRSDLGSRLTVLLGYLPVPATAAVLFVVVASVLPQLGPAKRAALGVVPVYIAFAAIAPFVGWLVARTLGQDVPASRAIAFSSSTRNSLVVLPLALAVPGAIPILPAVIVTQTLVELVSELIYVRLIPRLGHD